MLKQNKFLYRIISFILKPIIMILFPFKVEGLEKINNLDGGYIICSNHLSNLDPIFLVLSYPKPIYFMAKEELFKNKILGFFFSSVGAFSVKRGKGDKGALETAKQILKNNNVLGIFIEGTRSKTGDFLRPKSGTALLAYETKSNIVPVCITGTSKDHKIKLFKKTIIKYGKKIGYESLEIKEETRTELKNAANFIMDKIKELRN